MYSTSLENEATARLTSTHPRIKPTSAAMMIGRGGRGGGGGKGGAQGASPWLISTACSAFVCTKIWVNTQKNYTKQI